MSRKSKIQIDIRLDKIKLSHPLVPDVYWIEQSDLGRFYVTSSNGYNGYEGTGHDTLEGAIKEAKRFILCYFSDRCEENPKGF